MSEQAATKPLGRKAYGSIPHMGGSRMGPGDHMCPDGMTRIATERRRDRHDRVIVTEKLDGSNTCVANVDGEIVALGRAGYPAWSSPHEQHKMFAEWIAERAHIFIKHIQPGVRVCGEWLAQAHGTRYQLSHEPWVIFDVMTGKERAPWDSVVVMARLLDVPTPHVISDGDPIAIASAMGRMPPCGHHGALDQVEGAVWRVERRGEFNFMCKYVRPDKVDGSYLENVSGKPNVWNWKWGVLVAHYTPEDEATVKAHMLGLGFKIGSDNGA